MADKSIEVNVSRSRTGACAIGSTWVGRVAAVLSGDRVETSDDAHSVFTTDIEARRGEKL
jgi:hypothetical protein